MVTLLLCSIFWWKKDKGWGFELAGSRNFSLGESIVSFSFDPTWLVLIAGTPNHGSRSGLWFSYWR